MKDIITNNGLVSITVNTYGKPISVTIDGKPAQRKTAKIPKFVPRLERLKWIQLKHEDIDIVYSYRVGEESRYVLVDIYF